MIQTIVLPDLSETQRASHRLDVYRGDLENRIAPGNKFHKLRYHLKEAEKLGAIHIATFGGAYSNHLHAFSKTVVNAGFAPLIIVRGELQIGLTPTLRDCADDGAVLFSTDRDDYGLGLESRVKNEVEQEYANVYWIAEGGGGELGVLGCRDWADSISAFSAGSDGASVTRLGSSNNQPYDTWCVASGTGTTAVGLACSNAVKRLQVFNALKGAEGIENTIEALTHDFIRTYDGISAQDVFSKMAFWHSRNCGRFGGLPDEIAEFLRALYVMNPELRLDPVYTGKLVYNIWRKIKENRWRFRSALIIHTGGLQGWRGVKRERIPYPEFL
ncbi:1-aminocyclopropane-1-carboxylate deaminase/D-cysteine desulfhydrase [Marinomonas mediterranea]|uniref:1-aminocyclopropane-1-carboxylate deaminase/D-cysteine desulfhydrase n=1 Tax=Marinomonas mediterranea TaxID=119864 RepID=UPI002349C970|nr:cysteine desulfhydrase [Marinomonas mediterranea]WCN09267.1 cysteine desulfhydrase [Marinomonas mediterranea]